MTKKIEDKHSTLIEDSRMRYRIRRLETGRCEMCGEPRVPTSKRFCEVHRLQHNANTGAWHKRQRDKQRGGLV